MKSLMIMRNAAKLQWISLTMIVTLLLLYAPLQSQSKLYSEAPIIFQNGVRKSTQLTVHFKYPVLDLPRGTRHAAITDIASQFPQLITYFSALRNRYGDITFIKQIPNAVWGDVWRTNLNTGQLVRIHDMSQLFTVAFTSFVPIDSLIAELQAMDEVQYAHQPIQIVSFATPNDPSYGSQWNLPKINAPSAWDVTKGSATLKIGLIGQSGVKRDHPDLSSKIATGGDFGYTDSHETQVAGVAGAATNNSLGIASLGWLPRLGVYTYTPGPDGGTLPNKIIQAVNDTCRVINFSFSTARTIQDPSCQTGQKTCYIVEATSYPSVATAIANAITQGVVVVASAGNESLNLGQDHFAGCDPTCDTFPYTSYPAAYPSAIGISATDINDVFAGGLNWNYGSFVDVAAPGINILTTNIDNGYVTVSGTSFSSPHVAALAGLIKSLNVQLSPDEVGTIISNTAIDLGASGRDDFYGHGRINAYQALLLTHAYSYKSMSATATAANNGRRLVKTSDGKYHLVFESGITSGDNVLSEIYYRNSTDGVNWSTPMRLSAGNEQNRYPSITASGNNLYVVWQRYTGSTHVVYHRRYVSGAWGSTQTLDSNAGANAPLPVIASPAANELMVVYRSGGNLKWRRSTDNGSSWSTAATISGTALNSPTVAPAKTAWGANTTALAYATNVIPNASNILLHYYYNGWSSAWNLSSGLPGNLSQHANPSVAASGDLSYWHPHTAWDAYVN